MKNNSNKPVLFNLEIDSERKKFIDFKKENTDIAYVDTLGEQEHEIGLINNPSLISHSNLAADNKALVKDNYGVWVYFPWMTLNR